MAGVRLSPEYIRERLSCNKRTSIIGTCEGSLQEILENMVIAARAARRPAARVTGKEVIGLAGQVVRDLDGLRALRPTCPLNSPAFWPMLEMQTSLSA